MFRSRKARAPPAQKIVLTEEDVQKAISRTPRTRRYRGKLSFQLELVAEQTGDGTADDTLFRTLLAEPNSLEDAVEYVDNQQRLEDENECFGNGLREAFSGKVARPSRTAVGRQKQRKSPSGIIVEYDEFIETGKVTGYTTKAPRPGPKRKKRLVGAYGELHLTTRLPDQPFEEPSISKKNQVKTDPIATTQVEPPTSRTEEKHIRLSEFRRLLRSPPRPVYRAAKKETVEGANFGWLDSDLLQQFHESSAVLGYLDKQLDLSSNAAVSALQENDISRCSEIWSDTDGPLEPSAFTDATSRLHRGKPRKQQIKLTESPTMTFTNRKGMKDIDIGNKPQQLDTVTPKPCASRRRQPGIAMNFPTRQTFYDTSTDLKDFDKSKSYHVLKEPLTLSIPMHTEHLGSPGQSPNALRECQLVAVNATNTLNMPLNKSGDVDESKPHATGEHQIQTGPPQSAVLAHSSSETIPRVEFRNVGFAPNRSPVSNSQKNLDLEPTTPTCTDEEKSQLYMSNVDSVDACPQREHKLDNPEVDQGISNAPETLYAPIRDHTMIQPPKYCMVTAPVKRLQSRRPTKSIAEVLGHSRSSLGRHKTSVPGIFRTPTTLRCRPPQQQSKPVESILSRDTTTKIDIPRTAYVPKISLISYDIPQQRGPPFPRSTELLPDTSSFQPRMEQQHIGQEAVQLPPLTPPGLMDISGQKNCALKSLVPRRLGITPNRSNTTFIPPFIQPHISNQIRVQVEQKRHMTVIRYRPSLEVGMTRDRSNNTMTPSNGTKRKCRIQAAGGGVESEIEDTSVKTVVKRKRSRMTGRKMTMFAETPTKAYIHKVSNFAAVQEAWV